MKRRVDSDQADVIIIFNNIPPYAYEVNNLLALPNGFTYRFRIRHRWMLDIHSPGQLRNCTGLMVLRDFDTARFLPLRRIYIADVLEVGDVAYIEYILGNIIDLDSNEQEQRGQLVLFNERMKLAIGDLENRPGANLEKLLFISPGLINGIDDVNHVGDEERSDFKSWGNLIRIMGLLRCYGDFDFLKVIQIVDSKGQAVPVVPYPHPDTARFHLEGGEGYRVHVFHTTFPGRIADQSVVMPRQVRVSGEVGEVRMIRAVHPIMGKYDLYQFPFKTESTTQVRETSLFLEIKREDGRSQPSVDIPIRIATTLPTPVFQSALLPSLATPASDTASRIQPGSILIITATKTEAQAVLKVFSEAAGKRWTRQPLGEKTYYNIGIHGGAMVYMVQSEAGTATPGGALLTVSRAIQDLRPQAVIMCGFAFGLRPDKQQLGDVLVAKQLLYYEPQKVDLKQGQVPRGDRATSSERLLDRFRSGDIDWQGAQTHFGLVVSGEMLINDPNSRDWLLKTEPEAIGGEMEGAGLYAAARDAKVDWILVKAICDWADGEKTDAAQSLAAHNAVQFVWHVLQLGGWERPEQQREGILLINSALWGTEDFCDEYAPFLNSLITPEGTLSIRAHTDNFPDWPKSRSKTLRVAYTYKGQKGSKTIPEDDWLELP